jgi:hypothetical protein
MVDVPLKMLRQDANPADAFSERGEILLVFAVIQHLVHILHQSVSGYLIVG